MQWAGQAEGKRGYIQKFSDAAIAFCLTIKVLFGLALRQAIGFVQSLLQLAKLDWPVPDYSHAVIHISELIGPNQKKAFTFKDLQRHL